MNDLRNSTCRRSTVEQIVSERKVCEDLDEDCNTITDHIQCFLGHPERLEVDEKSGRVAIIHLPMANGYCPFIQAG